MTHVINTASLQISNYWASIGVKYLNFDWMDDDTQILFDPENIITERIYDFIEEAQRKGESCLVHSVRAQGRSAVALSVYFMRKYKWSLYKTLEFLNSRRPDLELKASFIRQMSYYEKRLYMQYGS